MTYIENIGIQFLLCEIKKWPLNSWDVMREYGSGYRKKVINLTW